MSDLEKEKSIITKICDDVKNGSSRFSADMLELRREYHANNNQRDATAALTAVLEEKGLLSKLSLHDGDSIQAIGDHGTAIDEDGNWHDSKGNRILAKNHSVEKHKPVAAEAESESSSDGQPVSKRANHKAILTRHDGTPPDAKGENDDTSGYQESEDGTIRGPIHTSKVPDQDGYIYSEADQYKPAGYIGGNKIYAPSVVIFRNRPDKTDKAPVDE